LELRGVSVSADLEPPGFRSEMADGGGEEGNASAHKGSARRRAPVQAALDADDLLTLMHGSDPVKVELNRLENEVRGELIRACCTFNSSLGDRFPVL
jgi:hypothetical protein